MRTQIELLPEPLREVEVVGFGDAAAGKRYAEMIQLFGTLLIQTYPFITLEHVERVVVALNYPLALQRYRAQAEVFAADFLQGADNAEGFAFATERGVIAIVGAKAILGTLSESQSTVAASSR